MTRAATAMLRAVEALMLEKFRTEPFHNLHLIYGDQAQGSVPGGTCSDKTLSFLASAEQEGFEVSLHSAFIGGREIHRLARVVVDGLDYFADVGNGWPALKLYPGHREVNYRFYGIGFRTMISGPTLAVFHEKNGKESLQLEIDMRGRPESDIRADIEGRFSSGVLYPFSNSLRFSLVAGTRFLFLRGDRLEIYSDGGCQSVEGIGKDEAPEVIRRYFGFEVQTICGENH